MIELETSKWLNLGLVMAKDKSADMDMGQQEPADRLAGGENFEYLLNRAKELGFSEKEIEALSAIYEEQMKKEKP